MEEIKKSIKISLLPPMRLEVLLLGLYGLFWIMVAINMEEWEWLRTDRQALYIYAIWGLIIAGFCAFRLKKWIISLRFGSTDLSFRRTFSLKPTRHPIDQLIVVRKKKKGKTLVKIFSKFCDFYGQFYLDEEKEKVFFNTFDADLIELVED